MRPPAPPVSVAAGQGVAGYSGDGRSATQALLSNVLGVGADAAGNLLIADSGNQRIRVVAASAGTFYGQAMTAGNLYTVGGNGQVSLSGNDDGARNAELENPTGIAANILVADTGNDRIRPVTG